MKKLIAILLLACLLLTLASCSKKDKEPAVRTFTGTMEDMNLTIIATGNPYDMQVMSKEAQATGAYTRKDNGTYVLDELEQFGGLTLTDCGNGFYKVTDSELEKDRLSRYTAEARIKLVDGSTYEAYMFQQIIMTYQTVGERKIVRQEAGDSDFAAEVWCEGANMSVYDVAMGSYTTQTNGDTKQVSIEIGYDTLAATLVGDKLTVSDGDEEFVLTRINDDTYMAVVDGEGAILRLKANGVAEILEEEESYTTGSINYEAGKTLEIVGDDGVIVSVKIDGDTLVYGNSSASYTLTEVK